MQLSKTKPIAPTAELVKEAAMVPVSLNLEAGQIVKAVHVSVKTETYDVKRHFVRPPWLQVFPAGDNGR